MLKIPICKIVFLEQASRSQLRRLKNTPATDSNSATPSGLSIGAVIIVVSRAMRTIIEWSVGEKAPAL
jgi:hypothetical protein